MDDRPDQSEPVWYHGAEPWRELPMGMIPMLLQCMVWGVVAFVVGWVVMFVVLQIVPMALFSDMYPPPNAAPTTRASR